MAAINLYPPIVDSYMPAFLNPYGDIKYHKCRIYFSLSSLNTFNDIRYVQISVVNQKTNKSALNPRRYYNGIKMIALNQPDSSTGLYYADLYVGKDITGNICDMEEFQVNQYYKVQFRFTTQTLEGSVQAEEVTLEQISNENYLKYSYISPTSNWIANNLNQFSEWSTVCLIKGISEPTFTFTSSVLNSLGPELSRDIEISENIPIIGTFGFVDSTETEYLKSYRITLANTNSEVIYEDTGDLFPDSFNPNTINYISKYLTEAKKVYTLRIDYTTNNLYTGAFVYKFSRLKSDELELPATLSAYLDKEDDQIMLKIDFKDDMDYVGDMIIKRASSDTNFNVWEGIHKVSMIKLLEVSAIGYLWGDITVQSGKWYKYAIQKVSNSGTSNVQYSENIRMEEPISLMLEELCIVGSNAQLKIKYDPKISSFNYKTVQSATETIGSKYPFIRRNGNIGYKTFNISGLITRHMDENELFASQADVYGNADLIPYYQGYNQENRINTYNDHTYEYLFREKVTDFLNDGKVKLFRSPSEGNILIVLSNISLTPNETLGRMIYTFSATATEVAAANIDNYILHNIIHYEATKYLLQGLTIDETDGLVTAFISDEDLIDGDYVINAGAQVMPAATTLVLSTF